MKFLEKTLRLALVVLLGIIVHMIFSMVGEDACNEPYVRTTGDAIRFVMFMFFCWGMFDALFTTLSRDDEK